MLLYNTLSWSEGELKPEDRAIMLFYNAGSWSAGDFIQDESDQHPVI